MHPFKKRKVLNVSFLAGGMPQEVRSTDVIADAGTLSPWLRRLVAAARDDNRRVAELCDAVLRSDWDTATILSRKLRTSPKPALPSAQAQSSANTQNCA
jgi:hypothetical protein